MGNLGLAAWRQGELDTARACFEQHLSLTRNVQDATAEMYALELLGHVLMAQREFEGAAEVYEQAAQLADENNRMGILKVSLVSMCVFAQVSLRLGILRLNLVIVF